MKDVYVLKPYTINEKELFLWLVGLFVAIGNILFARNKEISAICIIIEIVMLCYALLVRNLALYLALYLIFISLCLEFSVYVGTDDFYNLKNVRIAGVNLGIWLLLPIWVTFIKKQIKIRNLKSEYSILYKFVCLFGIMNALAAFMGILVIFLNDNNIRANDSIMRIYIEEGYSYLLLPISLFLGVCIVLEREREKLILIEYALKAALFVSVFQLLYSKIFSATGISYGYDTLLSSAIIIFIPLLILFTPGGRDRVEKFWIVCISFSGVYLSIRYNSSGKMLITLFICLILLLFIGKKRSIQSNVVLFITIAVIGAVLLLIILKSSRLSGNLSIKLSQTIGLLQFWKKDWLMNMGMSPRIRIEEMKNVIMEYAHKPIYFFTGKGYGGTVRDYGGYILSIPEIARGGTFSDGEYLNNAFYSLHEFSKPLLTFGVMWVVFAGELIMLTIRQIKTNLWLLIGMYWYLLFYGYSFTISTIGILCLLIGLTKSEGYRKGKRWKML